MGARSEILKVREVKTEPVVLGEQEGTFTIDTPLQFAAKFSRVLPGSVEVTVVVKNLSSSETPGRNQP